MTTLDTAGVVALKRAREGVELVSLLDEEAFRAQHIPGSWCAPSSCPDFAQHVLRRAAHRHRALVLYAAGQAGEHRLTRRAAELLREAGCRDVYEYRGGLKAWIAAGYRPEASPG